MAIYIADLSSTSGWTERWGVDTGSVTTTADGLRITKTAETSSYAISWDTVDSDADRDNAEILTKVRFYAQAAAGTMVGPMCRASGATGSEDIVRAYLADAGNDDGDQFILRQAVDSVATVLDSVDRSNVEDTWYWIRLRVNGTDCKARLWEDGTAEPATWTLEATTSVTAAGWVGIYAFDTATSPYDIGYFAVGTNGDSPTIGAARVQFIGV